MNRGRPRKADNQQLIRQSLLDAVAVCLSEKSYASLSIREIARAAGTTSAMIAYYFGGKQGLVKALLNQLSDNPAIGSLRRELASLPPAERSRQLVVALLSTGYQYPWLFRMVVDDLVNQDRELRQLLLETVASESNRLLDDYFRLQVEAGYFHRDFDPALVKAAFLGVLMFPFLAAPLLQQGYALDIHSVRKGQLVNHMVSTFEAPLLRESAREEGPVQGL
jgi:AcrR family transcriptional regulator